MGFIFWVIVILVAQGLFSYMQIQGYKAAADRLRKQGRIGVGTQRGGFSGTIVILASDANRVIVGGEMVQGMSVLAKFAPYTEYNGLTLRRAESQLTQSLEGASGREKKRLQATLSAVQMLQHSYDKKNYDQYVDKNAQSYDPMDISEETVVDAQIIDAHADGNDAKDVFEEYADFDEFAEPQIIDVEEFKEGE